ncbi:MAG: hypothetical protein J6X91_03900 [Bacteroidales bacterium]|nr:hypothetical protein [Bacteroidales bacterium]MBP5517784.1 hypothetical protein [Bacteroidales bacterium]
MKNKAKIILYVLLAISVVIGVIFLLSNKGEGDGTMVSPLLNWAYILLAIGILLAIFLPLLYPSGKGGKKTLINIGLFVAALVVSYLLASGNEVAISQSVEKPTHAVLKMTDTVLIMAIILLVVAILVTIFGSFIKKRS